MSLEIKPADREKWYIRIAMNWFIKKYSDGKNSKIIHEEIADCGNPIIRFMIKQRNKLTDKILERYQVEMIEKFSDFGLWIMYKDTAYRQVFIWFLKQILDNKKTLMPLVNKYYVDIDDMYVNLWSKSKKKTKEMQESGELPQGFLSEAEHYFVPSTQAKKQVAELEYERKKKGLS